MVFFGVGTFVFALQLSRHFVLRQLNEFYLLRLFFSESEFLFFRFAAQHKFCFATHCRNIVFFFTKTIFLKGKKCFQNIFSVHARDRIFFPSNFADKKLFSQRNRSHSAPAPNFKLNGWSLSQTSSQSNKFSILSSFYLRYMQNCSK